MRVVTHRATIDEGHDARITCSGGKIIVKNMPRVETAVEVFRSPNESDPQNIHNSVCYLSDAGALH
jgi:hypothetical protein